MPSPLSVSRVVPLPGPTSRPWASSSSDEKHAVEIIQPTTGKSSLDATKHRSITLSSSPRTSKPNSRRPSNITTGGAGTGAGGEIGWTAIDIRSLPGSLAASPRTSPIQPSRPRPITPMALDRAALLEAAKEQDVSPRTALFLSMKKQARQSKKSARKSLPKPKSSRKSNGVGSLFAPDSESTSLSSSLHSLSLSPREVSVSYSGASPSASSVHDSDDEMQREIKKEQKWKRRQAKESGVKLCKTHGCHEPRSDNAKSKYCRAHSNPNDRVRERSKALRRTTSATESHARIQQLSVAR